MKWIDNETKETMNHFYMKDLQTVKFGHYKFEFKNMTQEQNDIVCKMIDKMGKNDIWEIGSFAIHIHNLNIQYHLTFSTNGEMTKENLKEYATEFLPFVKRLIDNGIYKIPND